jgi:hypothetical protein
MRDLEPILAEKLRLMGVNQHLEIDLAEQKAITEQWEQEAADQAQNYLDAFNTLDIAVNTLKELQRYTAPDYPFKSAETIAEFHTLIGLALKEIEMKKH